MDIRLGRREMLGRLVDWLMAFSFTSLFPTRKARAETLRHTIHRGETMTLPPPRTQGRMSLESTIKKRRTVRSFSSAPLTLDQVSQLLWAAQGITEEMGFKRAAPSAGALYPMDLYAVVGTGGVEELSAGIYHYGPRDHVLSLVSEGDLRNGVAKAALSQMWIARPPLDLVITAEYARAAVKYGSRAERYAMIEAGHIGQNIFLQAEALGLGAGIVGAFHDEDLIRVMGIPKDHAPLLIMPVGYKG
jgi:SagB-type dehydrogenase family enzyme